MKVGKYFHDYAIGHNNNFNLLRFVAASLVLVTHSFAISTGRSDSEPLRTALGITLGSVAVDIFFIASGYLVTSSLLFRKNLREFIFARALRIFPGLWVSLAVTTLAIGLWFTSFSFTAFFSDPGTWKFLVRNAVLISGLVWTLPGAFFGNPGLAVNGSLWSLPVEIKMYLVLAAIWIGLGLLRLDKARWLSAACVSIAVVGTGLSLIYFLDGAQSGLIYLGAMFFSGAAVRVLQNRIRASHAFAFILVIALLVAAVQHRIAFDILYRLSLPYLVIYFALVPAGIIRRFNSYGDYSYGIYIYAFPVQQALVHVWRDIGPYQMMGTSFAITFFLAFASWHLIEQRALGLKAKFK